ncbi:MAG: phosphate ABC transporter substrate-binding protein PstS, partial [Spirochaetaceae bacterium]
MKTTLLIILLAIISTGFLAAQGLELTGSGATFPEPLYRKMFDEYNKISGVRVNYQGIGSGGGIKQLTDRVIDFGATDAFMTDEEIKATGAEIIHIPTSIGAVVIVYNLGGTRGTLRLTPEIISDIFLGKITTWNDPRITAENSAANLPSLRISVVHRSDGSGTSFVFTDYLSRANREWREKVGANKSPNWPAGVGGKGNPGVADLVKRIPGAIGYVELVYAVQNKISYADIKNRSGNYITPSLASSSLAAEIILPDDTRVSITDTAAKDGYPIASFTWIIIYKEQNYNGRRLETAKAVVNMLWWVVHDGQQYTQALSYAGLQTGVVAKCEKLLRAVTYDGKR